MRPKVSRRRDIIKIGAEVNETDKNKIIESVKAGAGSLRK